MNSLPTLRQLRHLVTLAEHAHFGRAARAAHVTQSTLSASIRELETTLGAALVDRTRRRVVFTPLGLKIVERARRLLTDAEELARLAREEGPPLAGEIRLGVIPTIGPYLLPRVLPLLRRRYPKLRLLLTEDLTDRLLAQLDDGTLDVLILALPYDVGGDETATIGRDPFSVVVPRAHQLAGAASVPSERLRGEPLLLLRDGHCLRAHALAACGFRDPASPVAFEATSLHTLVQMVDNGLGITLVPQLALDAGLLKGTGLVERPLAGGHASREIGLVWRANTARKPEFTLLAQELKDLWGERGGGSA
jgi:LysR family hydrogen peroxide-inducible transcriptional activator